MAIQDLSNPGCWWVLPAGGCRVLQTAALIPIETLISVDQKSPYYHDEDKVGLFYAEAWALTHFLIFGPGMETGK